jgi:hypothetical protein
MMKLCPHRARAGDSENSARRSAKASFFSMFRSVPLAALVLMKILSAAPIPQPFRQPLVFEPNRGQAQPEAAWTAHGPGYQLQLTDNAALMTFRERASGTPRVLKMKLAGSGPWNHVEALEPTGGVSNYINRPKGAASITGVPHYGRLKISNVYPGIDLVFYNDAGNLEYDFMLQPGTDPKQIQVAFDGQRELRLDDRSGDLVVVAPDGSELRQIHPKVYQQAGDHRVEVAGGYRVLGGGRAAFTVAAYDPQRPLVIDPTLQLVQYLGAGSKGRAIAVDSQGNSYMTGSANENFPVTNDSHYDDGEDHSFWGAVSIIFRAFYPPFGIGFQATPVTGLDTVVTGLNPQGTILFSTYAGLGVGTGIAVDSSGVVVTGWREDSDASDIKLGNGLFAMKLSLSGTQIYYSVLPGSDDDIGKSISLDSQHNAWIAGATYSSGLTGGSSQATPDALVIKVSPQGAFSDLKIFGGRGPDSANGIVVDLDDNAWVTGQTCSSDFPATPGFNYLKGKCGIFVLKLIHQSGPALTKFITVFGGGDSDSGTSIAVNANREAYVTGRTSSQVFYTSAGAYQPYPSGPFAQGFVTQFDGFGHFIHSTLIGSNGDTFFNSIAVNAAGQVYVAGSTSASTFPSNGPPVGSLPGIIAKLPPDLTTVYYSAEEGFEVNGLALRETVPSVTPAQIYSTGAAAFNNLDSQVFVGILADDAEYTHLRNYWTGNQYINIESGAPTASQIGPGWLSAQWEFDLQPTTNGDPANAKIFWIRNRWKSNQYLNIESGNLQSTSIGPGWLSARWLLEPINGTNVYRIRNVWQPDKCLNVESGTLRASPVEPGWWSSWWVFDRVF